jgi:hypothetical protein|nr:MAG TPA: hypothetical protein [Caudoviricetes sp.]
MAELDKIQSDQNSANMLAWEQGGVKTPFTLETNRKSLFEEVDLIQNQPYSNWETFKHSGKNMFEDTTIGVMQRYADIDNARRTEDRFGNTIDNPLLSREEANQRYSQYGVTFSSDIRLNEAEIIATRKIRETALKQRLQQTEGDFMSGASSLLGGMAGAMLDPINIATMFIPVTKIIPALKGLKTAGLMGKTAVRGIDGLVMNSLVEPLPLWMAGVDQRDYTMADSLFNVTAGGLFGAGIGAFTEGVRLLGPGEKFNAGLAASIDFANNRGYDTLLDFQKKNPAITSMAYDDLVAMPIDKLSIVQDGSHVAVRLAEEGPLSRVVGYGTDLETARTNLRKQIGALLDDDSIYSGYRIDDGIDAFYRALEQSNDNFNWLPKWLNTLQNKALKNGLSLEEYVAKQTNNFTDFTKLVKRAEQSRVMQVRFGELSGDALDDAIEKGAEQITAYAQLKDAFAANPKNKIDYKTFIGDLREKDFSQNQKLNEFKTMEDNIQRMREEANGLKMQLDNRELTTDRDFLSKQLNDLNASIKVQETDLNAFRKTSNIDTWKHDADNIETLEAMRAKLEEDPRTFNDVKEQLYRQLNDESGKTWDTSDSILDDLSIDEADLGDANKVAALQEEIDIATSDIKLALTSNRFTKEEIAALGIDADGQSIEMRRADKRIQDMDNFSKAAEDYAACRRTEVI